MVILAIAAYSSETRQRLLSRWPLLLTTAVASALLSAMVFSPYLLRSSDLRLERSVEELRYYCGTLPAFLTATPFRQPQYPDLLTQGYRGEGALFPGLLATFLLAIFFVRIIRFRRLAAPSTAHLRWRLCGWLGLALAAPALVFGDLYSVFASPPLDRALARLPGPPYLPLSALVFGGATAYILSRRRSRGVGVAFELTATTTLWQRAALGVGLTAALLALPVVYVPMRYLLPGLDSIRVTTRTWTFGMWAIALCAGWGLDRLLQGWRRSSAPAALLAACTLLFLWEMKPAMPWTEFNEDERPPIVDWIRRHADVNALVFYPQYPAHKAATLMFDTTWHGKPIVNGYSGGWPPGYWELIGEESLPKATTLDKLRRVGVSHVIIDSRAKRGRKYRRHIRAWAREHEPFGLKPVEVVGRYWVFRLEEARRPPSLQITVKQQESVSPPATLSKL